MIFGFTRLEHEKRCDKRHNYNVSDIENPYSDYMLGRESYRNSRILSGEKFTMNIGNRVEEVSLEAFNELNIGVYSKIATTKERGIHPCFKCGKLLTDSKYYNIESMEMCPECDASLTFLDENNGTIPTKLLDDLDRELLNRNLIDIIKLESGRYFDKGLSAFHRIKSREHALRLDVDKL